MSTEITAAAIDAAIKGKPVVDIQAPATTVGGPHMVKNADGTERDAWADCSCETCKQRRHPQPDGTIVDKELGRVIGVRSTTPVSAASKPKPAAPAKVLTAAEKALADAMALVAAAKAEVAKERSDAATAAAARAAAVKAQYEKDLAAATLANAPIEAKRAELAPKLAKAQAALDILLAQDAELAAQLIVVTAPDAPKATTAKAPAAPKADGTTRAAPGTGSGAYLTSVPYQFWYSYQKSYKNKAASQKFLSALAKANSVDMKDLSAENLAKMAALVAAMGAAVIAANS